MKREISSLTDLMTALNNDAPLNLELQTSVLCPYSIVLPVGFSLTGADKEKCIISFNNSDGIGLTANNEVSDLTIQTNPNNRAIYALSNHPDLGILSLKNLTISGQVQILTRAGTNKADRIRGNVEANGDDSIAIAITHNGQTPLTHVSAVSKRGIAVQIYKGKVTDRTGLAAKGAKGDMVESV